MNKSWVFIFVLKIASITHSLHSNNPDLGEITEGREDPLELTTSPLMLHQWTTPPAGCTGPLAVIYRSFAPWMTWF